MKEAIFIHQQIGDYKTVVHVSKNVKKFSVEFCDKDCRVKRIEAELYNDKDEQGE